MTTSHVPPSEDRTKRKMLKDVERGETREPSKLRDRASKEHLPLCLGGEETFPPDLPVQESGFLLSQFPRGVFLALLPFHAQKKTLSFRPPSKLV